jgi:hypothetical protein
MITRPLEEFDTVIQIREFMPHDRLDVSEREIDARRQFGIFQVNCQNLHTIVYRVVGLPLAVSRSDRLRRNEVNEETRAINAICKFLVPVSPTDTCQLC